MGLVEIRDHAIWLKHIHGDEALIRKLTDLPEKSLIELRVRDYRGTWIKMDDGKDGRPTMGIKPFGKAQEHWGLLQKVRGNQVSIETA